MGYKKNISCLNIGKNKDWTNSWCSYTQQEYRFLIQEDIILQSYFRSIFKDLDKTNITNVRLYRLNAYFFIDIGIGNIRLLNNSVISRLTLFLKNLVKFFKKDICLAVYKLTFMNLISNGFSVALRIAKLIEKRIKFRSKLVKVLLKKIKKNCRGIFVQSKGRINNADRAQLDKLYLGSVPFQSLNLITSFGLAIANTFKGLQSIKVWICK